MDEKEIVSKEEQSRSDILCFIFSIFMLLFCYRYLGEEAIGIKSIRAGRSSEPFLFWLIWSLSLLGGIALLSHSVHSFYVRTRDSLVGKNK